MQPLNRSNQIHRQTEAWKPPTYQRPNSAFGKLLAFVRRLLDLQNASIWNDLQQLLPQVRGNVLDVGAGAQPYRELFHADARYRAIDTSDAEANFGYKIPDTTYYDGDRWPIDDRSIDMILCTETLEHVPEPPKLLAEARRCLKPGGQILLTVPFAARWHYVPHDYWRYTPSALLQLLTNGGFTDVAVFARGNALTVACYKVMALMLPLLASPNHSLPVRAVRVIAGVVLSPVICGLAIVAQLSLMGDGGEDCLGYTAIATLTDQASH